MSTFHSQQKISDRSQSQVNNIQEKRGSKYVCESSKELPKILWSDWPSEDVIKPGYTPVSSGECENILTAAVGVRMDICGSALISPLASSTTPCGTSAQMENGSHSDSKSMCGKIQSWSPVQFPAVSSSFLTPSSLVPYHRGFALETEPIQTGLRTWIWHVSVYVMARNRRR